MLQISPTDLAKRLASQTPPVLLDVREQDEYAIVHLPSCTLIPLGELGFRMDELEEFKDREIVVYCHHGIRSLNAIGQLRHHGFQNLMNLAGGIDRWSQEVDPSLPRY